VVGLDYFDLVSVQKAFLCRKRSVDIRVGFVDDICCRKNSIDAVLSGNSCRTCEGEERAYLDDLVSSKR